MYQAFVVILFHSVHSCRCYQRLTVSWLQADDASAVKAVVGAWTLLEMG